MASANDAIPKKAEKWPQKNQNWLLRTYTKNITSDKMEQETESSKKKKWRMDVEEKPQDIDSEFWWQIVVHNFTKKTKTVHPFLRFSTYWGLATHRLQTYHCTANRDLLFKNDKPVWLLLQHSCTLWIVLFFLWQYIFDESVIFVFTTRVRQLGFRSMERNENPKLH